MIKVNQNKCFVLFRSEDVASIHPIMGSAGQLKYYIATLTNTKCIILTIEQAEQLVNILKPVDLSQVDEDEQVQLDTIDILLESLG
jgi:hypothetical protein